MSTKNTNLSWLLSVPHSLSLPPARLELPLVNLMLEDLSAVKVLESVSKLADVLGSIRYKYTVTMQKIVLPFTNIFNSMVILLLYCLKVGIILLIRTWNLLELIVKQCKLMIELKIQLLQPFMDHTLLLLLLMLHLYLYLSLEVVLAVDDGGVNEFMIDYTWRGDGLHCHWVFVEDEGVMLVRDNGVLYPVFLGLLWSIILDVFEVVLKVTH